jgi:hypothetical protein
MSGCATGLRPVCPPALRIGRPSSSPRLEHQPAPLHRRLIPLKGLLSVHGPFQNYVSSRSQAAAGSDIGLA